MSPSGSLGAHQARYHENSAFDDCANDPPRTLRGSLETFFSSGIVSSTSRGSAAAGFGRTSWHSSPALPSMSKRPASLGSSQPHGWARNPGGLNDHAYDLSR